MKSLNSWLPVNTNYLPDFIIGGAMKSGTTTLHQILSKHPDIFIAKEELGFFDMDNILEHPDFSFFDENKKWHTQNINKNPSKAWSWYYQKFEGANQQLKGEDSTTYLASPIAAKRIGMQNKEIKLIFILRHPTSRTISNYYHLLKSGRATYSLEETLQFNPQSILRRSLYKTQLEQYYKYLKPENIKIIFFEDLINNPESVVLDVCTYLNISSEKISKEDFNTHSNKTLYPKYEKTQLLYNRVNRNLGKVRYSHFLPFKYQVGNNGIGFREKFLKKIHKKINPKKSVYKPTLNPSTIEYLDTFFETELAGIDQLTGLEIMNKWFK
jgi:hypothetical protein